MSHRVGEKRYRAENIDENSMSDHPALQGGNKGIYHGVPHGELLHC
jgi:hypothetical protein